MGLLIPAGTGLSIYHDFEPQATIEPPEEIEEPVETGGAEDLGIEPKVTITPIGESGE